MRCQLTSKEAQQVSRALSCCLNRSMFLRVVSLGWVPVSSAYCSAGSPKASQPIGWSTLKPRMRWPGVVLKRRKAPEQQEVRTPCILPEYPLLCSPRGGPRAVPPRLKRRVVSAAREERGPERQPLHAPGVRKHVERVELGLGRVHRLRRAERGVLLPVLLPALLHLPERILAGDGLIRGGAPCGLRGRERRGSAQRARAEGRSRSRGQRGQPLQGRPLALHACKRL